MKYIEAPKNYERQLDKISIFLAGGITGCPKWQDEVTMKLIDTNLVVINPRRKHFPINDPSAAEQQITWEYNHLRIADMILFWFPKETLCPIVLYELGAWSTMDKPIFVGVHPQYQRRKDVEIQTKLIRPNVEVVYSLNELVEQIKLELL